MIDAMKKMKAEIRKVLRKKYEDGKVAISGDTYAIFGGGTQAYYNVSIDFSLDGNINLDYDFVNRNVRQVVRKHHKNSMPEDYKVGLHLAITNRVIYDAEENWIEND